MIVVAREPRTYAPSPVPRKCSTYVLCFLHTVAAIMHTQWPPSCIHLKQFYAFHSTEAWTKCMHAWVYLAAELLLHVQHAALQPGDAHALSHSLCCECRFLSSLRWQWGLGVQCNLCSSTPPLGSLLCRMYMHASDSALR